MVESSPPFLSDCVFDGTQRTSLPAVDFLVVGSGPAGAAVTLPLVRAGASVVVLEEGPLYRPEQFPGSSLQAMAELYREMGASLTSGYSPMPYLQGCAFGGSSVINGAISWRLPEDIVQNWLTVDPGLEKSLCWSEISRALDDVERRLHVTPTHPDIAGPNNRLMERGAERMGIEHRPIRRYTQDCRGLGRCLQGCPEGHKVSVDRSYWREAFAGGALGVYHARVHSVAVASGRAVGVDVEIAGCLQRLTARRGVILCASAVQSPLLLIKSGLKQGPVGEGFQAHPGAGISGHFDTPIRAWTGATQGHEVIGLRQQGLKFEALGFDLTIAATRLAGTGKRLVEEIQQLDYRAYWGVAVRAAARGKVRPARFGRGARVQYDLTPEDLDRVRKGVAVLGEMMLAAGAEYVSVDVHGWPEKISDIRQLNRMALEGPLDARAYSMAITHMFGTCRMGSSPITSVVDRDFQHHYVERLFVADSSVFPTNIGVNPQTSIMALATLCGEKVAAKG